MHQNNLENKFTLPFEGIAHKGTIIELPYRKDTWRCGAIPARDVFLKLVSIISKYETVYLVVDPSIMEEEFHEFRMENVVILRLPYNDSWARDNTLLFLSNQKERKAINYGFNAWGGSVDGLYEDYQEDRELGRRLMDALEEKGEHHFDFILEGGSIHSDGEGTLLTTEACLLSSGRNHTLSKEQIEEELKNTLGVSKVLWLPHGIYNDETNEHVDNMACFLAPGVVALATSLDKEDIQYQYSEEARKYLEAERDARGRKLEIIELPVPSILRMTKEEADGLESGDGILRPAENRLAGSYINFYMSDAFVLVPQFGVKEDQLAMDILRKYYPNKDVYGVESREILLAGGNIHCVTMQIPKVEGE